MIHYLEIGNRKYDGQRVSKLEEQLANERTQVKKLKDRVCQLEREQVCNSVDRVTPSQIPCTVMEIALCC